MANIIITIILIAVVGWACFYIWKEKKNGRHCMGCPSSGSCTSCHCCDKPKK